MLRKIIKRDGHIEDFMPDKLNRWAKWSIQEIEKGLVNWSEIVIEVMKSMSEIATSEELQNKLIDVCLQKETWSYSLVAGKLYATLMQKQIHGDSIPDLKYKHSQMIQDGIMIDMGYSDEEYEKLNNYIDHNRDLTYPHFALVLMREKYALKNVITGKEYESPQFSAMRVAMEVGAYARPHIDDVVSFVCKFYDYVSKRKINIPTPYWSNSGTKLRGFASCCIFESGDSADSLDAGKIIAGKMTQSSAGIGGHIVTRSIKDPVRNGTIGHLGKLPCYNAVAHVMKEFTQQGRGGAATIYYSVYDPEVIDLQSLKNPMTPLAKQNRLMDYAMIYNNYFVNAVKNDEVIGLYSFYDAPELYWAQFSKDPNAYEEELKRVEEKGIKPKSTIRAQELLANALSEAFETGRHYEFNATNVNKHTPFLEQIKSSNLCAEVVLPTKYYDSVKDLYQNDDSVNGEVALCNIGGIVYPNIESDDELFTAAELMLWLVDFGIHSSNYILPHIGYTAKSRLSAGIGIVGLAESVAKNGLSFKTKEGLQFIHDLAEKHYFALTKASLKLGKLLGNAPWIKKTKWPNGWLPIETYEENVDKLVTGTKCDWNGLRRDIIENGGIRNSVLVAHMPAETSSLSSATTNGVYPIRDITLMKKIGKLTVRYVVPHSDVYDYDIAWNIDPKDMINVYAVIQKWTDQAISLDEFFDVSNATAQMNINTLMKLWLYRQHMGLKTHYYTNTKTSKDNNLTDNAVKSKEPVEEMESCDSCTL